MLRELSDEEYSRCWHKGDIMRNELRRCGMGAKDKINKRIQELRDETIIHPDGYVHIKPSNWYKMLDILERFNNFFADTDEKEGKLI